MSCMKTNSSRFGYEKKTSFQEIAVERVVELSSFETDDNVAIEEPLEIQLGYGPANERGLKSISVTMRTPGDDFDLAVGFLLTEGIVQDAADIDRISYVKIGDKEGSQESNLDSNDRRSAIPYQPHQNIV